MDSVFYYYYNWTDMKNNRKKWAWLEQMIYGFPVSTARSDKLEQFAIFYMYGSKSLMYDEVTKYK